LDFQKFEILPAGMVQRVNMSSRAKFCADRSNHWKNVAIFRFLTMAAVRHLGFLKVQNFNCRYGSESRYASLCPISCQWSNRCQDMAIFQFFKVAATLYFN